ncbi:hypothetical protein ACIPK7_06350 [Pseudomonas sp. NPDC086581]|uniref:hypothetical protein n=1 Tax=Pseudomonas sp. NPDC086581 TaxID=3364432 RepID=UPI0038022ED0
MGFGEWIGLAGILVSVVLGTINFFGQSRESRNEAKAFFLTLYGHVGWTALRIVATAFPMTLLYFAAKDVWSFTISTAPITRLEITRLAVNVVISAYYLAVSIIFLVLWVSLHRKKQNPLLRKTENETAQQ